jgi:hypothetical protein
MSPARWSILRASRRLFVPDEHPIDDALVAYCRDQAIAALSLHHRVIPDRVSWSPREQPS